MLEKLQAQPVALCVFPLKLWYSDKEARMQRPGPGCWNASCKKNSNRNSTNAKPHDALIFTLEKTKPPPTKMLFWAGEARMQSPTVHNCRNDTSRKPVVTCVSAMNIYWIFSISLKPKSHATPGLVYADAQAQGLSLISRTYMWPLERDHPL